MKRGRGRPRKYPQKSNSDFESTKYDSFFDDESRKKNEGAILNIPEIVKNIFQELYKGKYSNKLFLHPENVEEISVLDNLIKSSPITTKPKNERTCDDVFYEYLFDYKDKTNEQYYILLVKFVILFKECYDISKNKDKVENEKKEQVTNKIGPDGLPDLCNEFYGEFLEPNNFFDIKEEDKSEIIEIIQHFCIWLFRNEYTKSKLSLAS